MKNLKLKWTAAVLILCLLAPVLAACGGDAGTDSNRQTVLRIAAGYGSDEEYIRSQFTELFELQNPNITIEIVPIYEDQYRYRPPSPDDKPEDPMVRIKEMMEGANPPDVVVLDYEQLGELVNDNLLLPLDPYMANDQFDTSDIVPAVIDGLKAAGDGKLFALAPLFSSNALIYNKKIFTDAGVPFPTDDMTWDQVFDLARRFNLGDEENRKYGFSFSPYAYGNNLFHELSTYTAPLNLTYFDDAGEKMTVDSDQWERVWSTMRQLNEDKVFPEEPDREQRRLNRSAGIYNPFEHDNFLSGRVAMTLVHYGQLNEIINANKNAQNIEGFEPIDWDVVTVPTHPDAPGIGGNVNMNGVMGINAKAQNPEDAWKFLKFVNGEDWAKIKSRSSYQLVSRKSYVKPKDGLDYNVAAFYKLTPVQVPNNLSKLYREKPNIREAQYIGSQYFDQMLKGELEVREALKEWQTAGDAILQQIKENPNGQIKFMPPILQSGKMR